MGEGSVCALQINMIYKKHGQNRMVNQMIATQDFTCTFAVRHLAASSCNVVWIAPGCLGPHGNHMLLPDLWKCMASWAFRTGSNNTSLTCSVKSSTTESSLEFFVRFARRSRPLTQTDISQPGNPSVRRAKFSKSLSLKLWGVSPRWTYQPSSSMKISKR